jgi:integrase
MRPPKPWYRKSKDAWYVEIDGRQVRLAKGRDNKNEALRAFCRLILTAPGRLPDPQTVQVAVVCDQFLDHSQKHHAADTYRWYRAYLQDFCEAYGTLPAKDLKPLHVSRWLDAHPGWKGSRRCAVIAVKRAFNWAETEGLLTANPVRKVRKPPQTYRERVLSAEERQKLLASIGDQEFRDFVFALLETGARPSEVRRVTTAHVRLDLGVWVFREHKTFEKTGKPRVVYLTPAMAELTRRLAEKYPTGPLFRGPRGGKPFTKNGVRCRFRRLRAKVPELRGVISYTLRHSYATHALVRGVGIAQVAELLGHADTQMVSRHYGHLAQQVEHMKDAARKAAGG